MNHGYEIFYFEGFNFSLETGIARFHYSFDKVVFFEEKIHFFDTNFPLRVDLERDIIENILFSLHIALGISYYKLYPTRVLIVESGKLDTYQLEFWRDFYLQGLGEFFYTNNIDFRPLLQFQSTSIKLFDKKVFSVKKRALLPIGGGKDSIVSLELLNTMGEDMTLFTFSSSDNILFQNTQHISGKKRLFIKRELSPNILEELQKGAYNGHVPITGLISFAMMMVAYLYEYKYIVFSNEKSANFGNTSYLGETINHQWSKSFAFESSFRDYLQKYISSDIEYFSLLRPFYELQIARIFSEVGKAYFQHFSSCNTNFKIFSHGKNAQHTNYWCNTCPKCLFVFTILSPFLSEDEMREIFGTNLFNQKDLEQTFKELLGISGIKPFECVGTNEEVVLSMYLVTKKYTKNLPYILEIFQKEVQSQMIPQQFEALREKLFSFDEHHFLPKHIVSKIKTYAEKLPLFD